MGSNAGAPNAQKRNPSFLFSPWMEICFLWVIKIFWFFKLKYKCLLEEHAPLIKNRTSLQTSSWSFPFGLVLCCQYYDIKHILFLHDHVPALQQSANLVLSYLFWFFFFSVGNLWMNWSSLMLWCQLKIQDYFIWN